MRTENQPEVESARRHLMSQLVHAGEHNRVAQPVPAPTHTTSSQRCKQSTGTISLRWRICSLGVFVAPAAAAVAAARPPPLRAARFGLVLAVAVAVTPVAAHIQTHAH